MGIISEIISAKIQSDAATEAAETQAQAATEAAQLQQQTAQQAIQAQEQAAAQQREDLQPFTQFGVGMIPQAQQAFDQSQALFGPGAGEAVMQSPMFQALQRQAQQDIMANQAVRGRLGTGETPMFLQDAALRTGFDILQQERNAALQNRNSLMAALGIGQTSAAGQGTGAMQAAANIGNTLQTSGQLQGGFLTDAAAAQAAGTIGSANAITGGIQGINQQASQVLGAIIGNPQVGGSL